MKIRNGFVSNSSSSSFVCDVCKHSEVIYDGGDDDSFCKCVNGHSLCRTHLNKAARLDAQKMREALIKDIKGWATGQELEDNIKEFEEMDTAGLKDAYDDVFGGFEIPEELCPLCTFTTLSDDDLMNYLLMTLKTTKKEAIKTAISTYEDLKTFESVVKEYKKSLKTNKE